MVEHTFQIDGTYQGPAYEIREIRGQDQYEGLVAPVIFRNGEQITMMEAVVDIGNALVALEEQIARTDD